MAVALALTFWTVAQGPPAGSAEAKALAFLSREVPLWRPENRCASCHNNGDAARALYAATARPDLGRLVPAVALADTTAWLSRPEGWDTNGGDGPFSDKRLARVQFAAALASAVEAGAVPDKAPLIAAARRLAEDQGDDGAFRIDGPEALGSPCTYGNPLATAFAIRTLRTADPVAFRRPIERAGDWLAARPARNVPDASAALMALDPEADRHRPSIAAALDFLRRAQGGDGGFGPYPQVPPEPFDTALAILALDRSRGREGVPLAIRRARSALVAMQGDDGSWPETTRPPRGESYAQRLSTAGWAALALLATADD